MFGNKSKTIKSVKNFITKTVENISDFFFYSIYDKLYIMHRCRLEKKEKESSGLRNEKSVKIIPSELFAITQSVSCKYTVLREIEKDLFIVQLRGKYGVIDINDNKVIPFKYNYIHGFTEGLLPAQKGKKFGYINIKNEVVIDFKFGLADLFSNGLAPVMKNCKHLHTIKTGGYQFAEKNGTPYGYVNKKGEYVIEPKYSYAECFCKSGIAAVKKTLPCSGHSDAGVIDTHENIIVPLKYKSVTIYNDCIQCENSSGEYRYFDLTGNPIEKTKPKWDFSNHIDYIWKPYKCKDIFELNINLDNDSLVIANKEFFMYSTSQLKYGWYEIIGKDAVCRIKPIYDEQVRPCITDTGEIYSVVKQNGLFGIIKFNDKRFPTNYKI